MPAAASLAATLTASLRLAGPSAPGADAGRMAPVTTIGASASWTTSASMAVSSSVSVPWVITTPIPRRAASRAARQICSWSSSVRWALGTLITVSASMPWRFSRPGIEASRAAPSSSGVTPPLPSLAMAMVPPAASTRTRRVPSAWRCSLTPRLWRPVDAATARASYPRTMFDHARAPLKAALVAAFTVGVVLFLIDPPSLSGLPGMAMWIGGAVGPDPDDRVGVRGDDGRRRAHRAAVRPHRRAQRGAGPPARARAAAGRVRRAGHPGHRRPARRVPRPPGDHAGRGLHATAASTAPTATTSATPSPATTTPTGSSSTATPSSATSATTRELLRAQVTRTVRHELAHHLGWNETGVERLGL